MKNLTAEISRRKVKVFSLHILGLGKLWETRISHRVLRRVWIEIKNNFGGSMIIKNTYLDIAENDLEYLEAVLKTGNTFYNQLAVQCQQIAEKFLKGYLERLLLEEDVSDLLRKNNMRKIAAKLNDINPELNLDIIGLSYLTDFYFDARYPSDNFHTVSKEEFEKCLAIMYDTVNKLKSMDL